MDFSILILAYESKYVYIERGEKENEKEHTMAKNEIFRGKSFI